MPLKNEQATPTRLDVYYISVQDPSGICVVRDN